MEEHFFITNVDRWVADEDLNIGLTRFWRDDHIGNAKVYKVPLPIYSAYKIENYKPVVEGSEFITECYKDAVAKEYHTAE